MLKFMRITGVTFSLACAAAIGVSAMRPDQSEETQLRRAYGIMVCLMGAALQMRGGE